MAKAIMIQGTMSNSGKTFVTAGLCRVFKQDGYKVAPFKSQNMALNSYITKEGLEIGRAQAMQAEAAMIEPTHWMNPILLKPTSSMGSQVIVNGEVYDNLSAQEYYKMKDNLAPEVMKAFNHLSEENDIIVIEGAGSPAEINLAENDIVNMGMAKMADAPVILVADIDRGGVFASAYGTIKLLPVEDQERFCGIVINKFRGDVDILKPGLTMLEDLTGKPVLGVIPMEKIDVDDEDSLSDRLNQKTITEGNEIVIAHGNGPQVGMIQNAMTELRRSNPEKYVQSPLSVCVAMSQGYIGYDLQNALREELLDRGIQKDCATMLTQVEVSPDDPAFKNPTKPIGSFMTKEEADELVREKGYKVIEDSGRGYRRVVASPKPVSIVEIDTIKALVESNHVVIACGGGGIPVFKTGGHHLKGAAAVIDKDFAAEKLAEQLNADCLIILTAVEKVAIHFGTPEQEALSELTPELAEKYIEEGEFPAGSMLPKVQAAVAFTQSGEGRTSLITLLEKAKDGIAGKTGTLIHQ